MKDTRTPLAELERRHERCRSIMARLLPQAGGLLVLNMTSIYYLSGSAANGVFWLPLKGRPVLAIRKGAERARHESYVPDIVPFHSFRELPQLASEAGSPLSPIIATDMAGSSWATGAMLSERLRKHTFISGDSILIRARAIKSPWELEKMRESGDRLHQGQRLMLPKRIHPGMSELAIAHESWRCNFELGHHGPQETGLPGIRDMFLGYVAAGNNANYSTAYDGPVGVFGQHPATPFMGNSESFWNEGMLLTLDSGFNFEGYLSDRTQVFFAGKETDIPSSVRKAHETALHLEKVAAAMLRPGAVPTAIYQEILRQAENAGYGEGFMGLGANKVRFLGHGIGLTISEWPIITRSFEPLEAGMVIALEPKIGLPGIGMAGSENTYEITDDGARCLTGDNNNIICIV